MRAEFYAHRDATEWHARPLWRSDGGMTTTPTGYPEEMKGDGKVISPADNKAAKM